MAPFMYNIQLEGERPEWWSLVGFFIRSTRFGWIKHFRSSNLKSKFWGSNTWDGVVVHQVIRLNPNPQKRWFCSYLAHSLTSIQQSSVRTFPTEVLGVVATTALLELLSHSILILICVLKYKIINFRITERTRTGKKKDSSSISRIALVHSVTAAFTQSLCRKFFVYEI